MGIPTYPSLYQINTRVWLTDLSKSLGRPATLDDIPESELSRIASMGFDWLWFLSVWTTGEKGKKISRENAQWVHEFKNTLPDLKDKDVGGSGFAISGYEVHPDLGGNAALKRLRKRMADHGLKLMLDFVPNHMGPDHPWVQKHPDYFVAGSEDDLAHFPQNYTKVSVGKKEVILDYGRDPYFAGWPDTVQLDYSNPKTVEAMGKELLRISGQCDGVRCDMAMLILPEVFEKTWGRKAQSFWPETIKTIKGNTPGFCFMAEVYWDLEWTLLQLGFDYTYDKRLYDRLLDGCVRDIRAHLSAGLDYQNKMARFLENHDEPRAATAFSEIENHKAAAVILFLSPGLRFFHQGQFEGKTKRISPHLVRGPKEPINKELLKFYTSLLSLLKKPLFREGKWRLLECVSVWEGNNTWENFIAYGWESDVPGDRVVVVINFKPYRSQCYLKIPFPDFGGSFWRLKDLMGKAVYERNGDDMRAGGLFLDMDPWGYHVFEIKRIKN